MALLRPSDRLDVTGMPWEEFLPWWKTVWKPGQHVALIGPTESGKSSFAVGVLPERKYVLGFDPKGGDSTLATLGWDRINTWRWPLPQPYQRDLDEGRPVRLIVGPKVTTTKDRPRLKTAIRDALTGAFDTGGWTLYVDELQLAADSRMMGLAPQLESIYIAARDKGVSMMGSFQAPRWVPRAASDQSAWMVIWYTRDVDVVNRLAEMTGRPKAEIRGAMRSLEPYACLIFSRNPRAPIVATRPPKP